MNSCPTTPPVTAGGFYGWPYSRTSAGTPQPASPTSCPTRPQGAHARRPLPRPTPPRSASRSTPRNSPRTSAAAPSSPTTAPGTANPASATRSSTANAGHRLHRLLRGFLTGFSDNPTGPRSGVARPRASSIGTARCSSPDEMGERVWRCGIGSCRRRPRTLTSSEFGVEDSGPMVSVRCARFAAAAKGSGQNRPQARHPRFSDRENEITLRGLDAIGYRDIRHAASEGPPTIRCTVNRHGPCAGYSWFIQRIGRRRECAHRIAAIRARTRRQDGATSEKSLLAMRRQVAGDVGRGGITMTSSHQPCTRVREISVCSSEPSQGSSGGGLSSP